VGIFISWAYFDLQTIPLGEIAQIPNVCEFTPNSPSFSAQKKPADY
jgi:hypothetical protein